MTMQPDRAYPVPVEDPPDERQSFAPWIPFAVPLFALTLLGAAYLIFAMAL